MTPSPLTPAQISAAVARFLPGRAVQHVEYRGAWIRHNYKITLDRDQVIYLKMDDAFPASQKEAFISRLLIENGLPAPRTLGLDLSGELLPAAYILQEQLGGQPLGRLLGQLPPAAHPALYRGLGEFYRRLHRVSHPHAGWITETGETAPFSPHDYQYQQVIVNIGSQAVAQGLLSPAAHQRLQAVWSRSLPWLKDHPVALVAGALHWAVCLAPRPDDPTAFQVTRVMDLHDALYWDPGWDLAEVRYPTFLPEPTPELWAAFLSTYGPAPDDRRLKLYVLMQHLDAALGNYMEPPSPLHEQWKRDLWPRYEALLADPDL